MVWGGWEGGGFRMGSMCISEIKNYKKKKKSRVTTYSLDILLSQFGNSVLFHVQFCCSLTCIQISQKAGQVVWYSHLLKNFPQSVVIHTVKGFGIFNKAEVDVCFFGKKKNKVIRTQKALSYWNYCLYWFSSPASNLPKPIYPLRSLKS